MNLTRRGFHPANTQSRFAPTTILKTSAVSKLLSKSRSSAGFLDVGRNSQIPQRLSRRMVFLDLRAKPDSTIAVRLIPHMHHSRCTMRLLRFAASDFRRHTQRAILMASVKCSLLSEARLMARKRKEVRMLWRATWRRSELITFSSTPGRNTNPLVREGIYEPNRGARLVK